MAWRWVRLVPRFASLLVVLLPLALAPASAADPLVLVYDLAGLAVPGTSQGLRGPETSVADPSGGVLSRDGRFDVGRVLADVPAGARIVTFELVDAAHANVPIEVDAFAADGPRVSAYRGCSRDGEPITLDLSGRAAVVSFRVRTFDAETLCAPDLVSGATRGTIALTFGFLPAP